MPLGDGTSGIGQHVGPVAQTHTGGTVTHEGLPNGVVAPQFVIVVHCDDHLHFLEEETNVCCSDTISDPVELVTDVLTSPTCICSKGTSKLKLSLK